MGDSERVKRQMSAKQAEALRVGRERLKAKRAAARAARAGVDLTGLDSSPLDDDTGPRVVRTPYTTNRSAPKPAEDRLPTEPVNQSGTEIDKQSANPQPIEQTNTTDTPTDVRLSLIDKLRLGLGGRDPRGRDT